MITSKSKIIMTLNEKIEEYISIVNQSKANMHQQIVDKIISEEDDFTYGEVKKFIKRIQKETNVSLDEAQLWNAVRDK